MSAKEIQRIFIDEALVAHNDYRLLHNSPPLAHNPQISKIALSWALNLAKKDDLEHSDSEFKGEALGENLALWFEKGADRLSGVLCTEMWYEEIEHFNWKKPDFDEKAGHFTQMMWKDSAEVGFGIAISKRGNFFPVANYFPPGNIDGSFKENVLEPTSASKKEFKKTSTYVFTTEVLGKEHKTIEEKNCIIS